MSHLTVLAVFVLALPLINAADRHPNVLVFLADDAGWGDYGATGNNMAKTEQIDAIAAAGVTVDRFFVCPVCSPTRAEFLTGRYHPRGGVRGVSTGQERLNADEKTIADALHAAGYATGAFGKWHNGSQWPYHPMARGFDTYFGHTSGHWGEYFNPPLEDCGRMVQTTGYIVDVCTDRALAFIDAHKDRPFFCFIPFTTPHSPWAAPAKNWSHFKDLQLTQRATEPKRENEDQTRCALAMLENQSWNVGRVLTRIEELGLGKDTIVIYFSDNGPNGDRWTGGMKGKKGTTDEGGVRSSCFIRWSGHLPAGHTVTQISGAFDLLPTLLALTGVQRVGDKPLDGRDLSPLLRNEPTAWPERMLFSTWAGKVSVRTQTHRLDHQGKLFDMVNDPGQTAPINKNDPDLARKLAAAVEAWRNDVFANLPEKVTGKSVDQRPISVGYKIFPITMLPARDGEPHGGIKRSGRAPNCSYFVNWTATNDSMEWLVDVVTSGRYQVTIDYTCPISDVGSTIELSHNGAVLSGTVAPGWDPPINTDQDTIPRNPVESQMKPFKTLELGVIELTKGYGPLTLRATKVVGRTVMDVRRVTLTLLPD